MNKRFDNKILFWIGVAVLFFFPLLGEVSLFDKLELKQAEIAREMVLNGNYLVPKHNFEHCTQLPPFFIWLQALSFAVFGVSDFAARLPNALLGVVLLPLFYLMGKRLFDEKFGFFWALAWAGSILPFVFMKSAMIEPVANLFTFFALYFFVLSYWKHKNEERIALEKHYLVYLFFSGVFAGLALLSNGMVALILISLVITIRLALDKFAHSLPWWTLLLYAIFAFIPTLVWFGFLMANNEHVFLLEYFNNQTKLLPTFEKGWEEIPGFHFIVLIIGCFPASLFALQSIANKSGGPKYQRDFKRWMLTLMWVVVGLFTVLNVKLIHYSSLAYFPITYLAALSLFRINRGEWLFKPWMRWVLLSVAAVLAIIPTVATYIGYNPHGLSKLLEINPDWLAALEAEFYWFQIEYFLGIVWLSFFFYFLWFIKTKNTFRAFQLLFFGTTVISFTTLALFVGKFEKLAQQDYVQFLVEMKNPNEQYHVFYQRPESSIPLFYARQEQPNSPIQKNNDWLLYGETDKDVLIVCRNAQREQLEREVLDVIHLETRDDFHFFIRKATN
jgi:4-amino-4-deoxy-L-arabinose transferase-like glycosyltransferase